LNCGPGANTGRYGGIANDCYSRHTWRNLLEQLQPFHANAVFIRGKAGGVGAGPRQAGNKARAYRTGCEREPDGHAACRALQWSDRRTARGEDHIRRERDQLGRVFAGVILIARGPAVVDRNVGPDRPTQLLQPLQKSGVAGLHLRIVCRIGHEYADAPHALALLRARRERPRRRAAEQRDERAPVHSITSSAGRRNGSGIVSPSTLAVLRFTTSSNFVGCSTGKSAGRVPRKILST